MSDYSPFFDQNSPEIKVDGMIASCDKSQPYELDAQAIFKCGHRFLFVHVSGCSCWPDRGSTEQVVCTEKAEIDKLAWSDLIQQCQLRNWQVEN